MNLQEPVQPRSSANGHNRRRAEKEMGPRIDNRLHPGKVNPNKVAGLMSSDRGGNDESTSQDLILYFSTCLIGLDVEVQVKNGSVFSGIFHSTNADKDFGIVLKMARLIKDASSRGQKAASNTIMKAPSKTQIIPAQEFVQIIAKNVPITTEGLNSDLTPENRELLLDSNISKSCQSEGERQLERWLPDEEDLHCGELENIFDKPWTGRSWDQFKVNEALFGVKSTFNEELYTTKLEKGPQMREVEEKATRIAREIEGEDTHDLHLAEERGIYCQGNEEIDEETRYSSVFRGVDDSGYADEDALMDTKNDDTFGDSSPLTSGRSFADVARGKIHDRDQGLSSTSVVDGPWSSHTNREPPHSGSPVIEHNSRRCDAIVHDVRIQGNHSIEAGQISNADSHLKTHVDEEPQASTAKDLQSMFNSKEDASIKGIPSAEAATATVSDGLVKSKEKTNPACSELTADAGSRKVRELLSSNSTRGKPSSSVSIISKGGGTSSAATGPVLSPSSSMSSLTSEKSTLNPNAKEFKLNPNAKVFVPSQTSPRPASPVAPDNSFYFPAGMPAGPPMHVGPSFPGQQPMMFNSQAAPMQSQHMYFPPNGPQYGQQMLAHPRQVMYMQSYPTEMPYKGREF